MPRQSCMSCCTCVCYKPRYKRLVDGIFPKNRQEGLNRSNMDKLTFYAVKSPDKLDRIGQYLEQKINRRRGKYIPVAMEAFDQLLAACHAHANVFAESYLRTIQKLLESPDVEYQELATNSFAKFANIREDTPPYHRRYDFFVSRFSTLCHSGDDDIVVKARMRVSGLRGLHGIVRKTAADEGQFSIWEQSHLDKIVPSLLYNMQDEDLKDQKCFDEVDAVKTYGLPCELAEECLRDLVSRAAYGNVKSVLRPALRHLDCHKLWVPNDFAIKCFKLIMYAVDEQYSLMAVEILQKHLDEHCDDDAKVKTSIVIVLAQVITIGAGAIGPSVLDFINTMIRHLRKSVSKNTGLDTASEDETEFCESIINTVGIFASNFPDYQKVEVMTFILTTMHRPHTDMNDGDVEVCLLLLRCISMIANSYKTTALASVFPRSFLHPMLQLSVCQDRNIRLLVQEVFQHLVDRHDNNAKLKESGIQDTIEDINLTYFDGPSRQDIMFVKEHGMQMYNSLYENIQLVSNSKENLHAVWQTLIVLCLEVGCDTTVIDMIRLAFEIQSLGTNPNSGLSGWQRCATHAIAGSYLDMISQLVSGNALSDYVHEVLKTRADGMPQFLPSCVFSDADTNILYPEGEASSTTEGATFEAAFLFDKNCVTEAMKTAGHETQWLGVPLHFQKVDAESRARSNSDVRSLSQIDIDSVDSSPGVSRFTLPAASASNQPQHQPEEVTIDMLRAIVDSDSQLVRNQEQAREERSRCVVEMFRQADFEKLVAQTSEHIGTLEDTLASIQGGGGSSALEEELQPPVSTKGETGSGRVEERRQENVFEMKFPDMFVY